MKPILPNYNIYILCIKRTDDIIDSRKLEERDAVNFSHRLSDLDGYSPELFQTKVSTVRLRPPINKAIACYRVIAARRLVADDLCARGHSALGPA